MCGTSDTTEVASLDSLFFGGGGGGGVGGGVSADKQSSLGHDGKEKAL